MLGDHDAVATVGVHDVKRAQDFYEQVLGLTKVPGEPGALIYKTGKSTMFVYESKYAGTNQATAVTFALGADLEPTVKELKSRGVTFEHYDFPDSKLEGDIHVMGKMKAAWFKDPDGNIFAIVSG